MNITSANPDLYDQILTLNESEVPHVNSLSMSDLENLGRQSRYFFVNVDEDENVRGFVLALDETADYQSPNYQYFCRTYRRFIYIDRIVVGSVNSGKGIGRGLYDRVLEAMPAAYPFLTCEVNLSPPNPGSLAFHEKMGFERLDEQDTENGTKRVLLMSKSIAS